MKPPPKWFSSVVGLSLESEVMYTFSSETPFTLYFTGKPQGEPAAIPSSRNVFRPPYECTVMEYSKTVIRAVEPAGTGLYVDIALDMRGVFCPRR